MPRLFKRNRCPQCGVPTRHGAVLCVECGHRLGAERLSEHCGKCGARLAAPSEACPICGALRIAHRRHLSAGTVARLVIVLFVGIVGLVGWRLHRWELLRDRFQALASEPTQEPTPSPYPTWTPRPTEAPTAVPSVTPQPTRTLVPTATPIPTVMPTATVEVLRYTVASGDTPLGIALQFGVELVDLLNLNDLEETALLQIGQELVISGSSGGPLLEQEAATGAAATSAATPTAAPALVSAAGATSQAAETSSDAPDPLPDAAEPTSTPLDPGQAPRLASAAAAGPVDTGSVDAERASSPTMTPASTATPDLYRHVVEQGDMLLSLAQRYDVTVEEIIKGNKLSPQALLNIGQRVIIPNITNTPTLSPTPEVTETPTPTITPSPTVPPKSIRPTYPYQAPVPLAPVNGATIVGVDQDVVLNWASVGILSDDEWYLVELWLPGTDKPLASWTKATSLRVASELCDKNVPWGEYYWQVQVAVRDESGRKAAVQSAPSAHFSFLWR